MFSVAFRRLVQSTKIPALFPFARVEGIGVDLGIKSFALVSDGREFPNANKRRKIRKLEKKLEWE